ncbi:MAG: hypothetical protein JNM89_04510 [Hyphomicrobiaceae bacterium]|nr:hypothetical protein [Hyphomicrobiaceae bacterium]
MPATGAIRFTRFAALVLAAAAPAGAACAEDAASRFTMTPSPDGLVRLDTTTGAVSLCAKKDGEWACRALPDDQKTLQDRVAKLEEENRSLKDENRRLEDVMGLNGKPGTGEAGPGRPAPEKLPLPTEKDVDKAFDYVEGMLRKFRERLKKLDDPDTKGGPDGPYRTPSPAPGPDGEPKPESPRGT